MYSQLVSCPAGQKLLNDLDWILWVIDSDEPMRTLAIHRLLLTTEKILWLAHFDICRFVLWSLLLILLLFQNGIVGCS